MTAGRNMAGVSTLGQGNAVVREHEWGEALRGEEEAAPNGHVPEWQQVVSHAPEQRCHCGIIRQGVVPGRQPTGGTPAPDPLHRPPPPSPPPPPWKLAGKCRTMGAEGALRKFCLT